MIHQNQNNQIFNIQTYSTTYCLLFFQIELKTHKVYSRKKGKQFNREEKKGNCII